MNLKSKFLFLGSIFLFISCDEKRVFDDYKSVGDFWHKDSIVVFDLPKTDIKKTYNLFVTLRGNNDYKFNNIFVIVNFEQPDRVVKVDTLEYQMADVDGNLLGNGFSDVKESKLIYKENIFLKAGNYKVKIKQALRKTGKISGETKLEGITDVGFRIETID